MNKYLIVIFFLGCFIISCDSNKFTYYELDEIDLVPEGIAYSETTNRYYLTSITKSKIICVDKASGKQQDFISER